MPFTRADEGAHESSDDPFWSETACVVWYDRVAKVGGMHHLGHEVNVGSANFWHGLLLPDGSTYRSWSESVPLLEGDRTPTSLAVDDKRKVLRFDDKYGYVSFGDDETQVELTFEDFYPSCEVWEDADGGEVVADLAPKHLESSGRATGVVRVGDQTIECNDVLFHRDHSWGKRDYSRVLNHRWMVGTAGPEFSFCATTMTGEKNLVVGGYVVINGRRIQADEIDIVVGMEPDSISARNAQIEIAVAGETYRISAKTLGGHIWGQDAFRTSDQIALFTTEHGPSGFLCVELSMNTRQGRGPIPFCTGAQLDNGYREPYRSVRTSMSWELVDGG
jgi:hypothetical protein